MRAWMSQSRGAYLPYKEVADAARVRRVDYRSMVGGLRLHCITRQIEYQCSGMIDQDLFLLCSRGRGYDIKPVITLSGDPGQRLG